MLNPLEYTPKNTRRLNYLLGRHTSISEEEAFQELGRIDELHEAGRISKAEHNKRSREVLRKMR